MTKEEIIQAFDDFQKVKVLIIGDVMIDSYIWGKVDRISPEAPVPIVAVNRREDMLGGAANVALNIKALGATPILCSVIGKDSKAFDFERLLNKDGLPSEGIIQSKERITTVKFRVIGNNTQLLRVDEEVTHDLSSRDEALLQNQIFQLIENNQADVILFQDYNKGVITAALIENVIARAKRHNIPVVVDPKKKNFENFKGVTLFKPNLKELKEGLNIEFDDNNREELIQAVNQLQEQQDIQMVMATLSENGVFISFRNKTTTHTHAVPAHVRQIADVSGAGDTVISVAAICLALNIQPADMAAISNLAGGLVCEYVGVVPVDKTRLLNETIKLHCS